MTRFQRSTRSAKFAECCAEKSREIEDWVRKSLDQADEILALKQQVKELEDDLEVARS